MADEQPKPSSKYAVVTDGSRQYRAAVGESFNIDHRAVELGAGEIVLTSMDADGTKSGYDLPMLEAVGRAVTVPLVASGGAGHPEHLRQAFRAGADAALAASIFHFGEIGVGEAKHALADAGLPVRLAA